MTTSNLRKTLIASAVAVAAALAGPAVMAQAPQGQSGQPGPGMGPGMMGGPGGGYGPGMMGGRGYGHGYGMGPGTAGGPGGYGPGYGMGPGMMGGGMMGGGMMGGGMMGGGMMGGMGYGMLYQLNLTPDQWKKVEAIHEETRRKNWDLMGKMQDEGYRLRQLLSASPRDRKAIGEQYRKMNELRQQRFEARLDAHDRLESVLTPEQRDRLWQFGPWWADE